MRFTTLYEQFITEEWKVTFVLPAPSVMSQKEDKKHLKLFFPFCTARH